MEESITLAKEGVSAIQTTYVAANAVSQWWNRYDETALTEIKQIQSAYTKHCGTKEKKCLHLSTLEESTQTLPLHFRMNDKEKVPVLFERGFCPKKQLQHWVSSLSQNLISNFIEDMLGYICEYQAQRDERPWPHKGYDYDPTNLFLEEFKEWLVVLSKASVELDPKVMAVIEGRMNYLSYLINNCVFNPGQYLPTREMVIAHLRDIFAKNIKPIVELAQLRQSAREHFRLIKLNTQCLVKQGTEFLFYVFRNSPNTPVNFIMTQIKHPTLPNYAAVLLDRSGRLLQYLVNTPAVKLVHPELNAYFGGKPLSQELVNLTMQSLTYNHFLDDDNRLIYPFSTQTIDNWYQGNDNPSGILSFFQKEEYMMAFMKMHQQLEELAVFYLICSLIFELAGEGGNLIVYRYAMNDVRAVIEQYEYFIKAFKENIDMLWNASEGLQNLIIAKKVKETEEVKRWRTYKALSSSAYQAMSKLIQDNYEVVKTIKTKILETNTEDYLAWVKKQTEFLSELAKAFCKHSVTSSQHEPTELEEKPHLSLSFWSKSDDDEEDVLEKMVEFYNVAYVAYYDGNYTTTEKIVSQLFSDYPQASWPFRNDLLVLRYQSYLKLGNFDAALKNMDDLLNTEPDNLQCRLNKAYLLYHHTHHYQEAKNEIEEALKIDSANEKAIEMKKSIDFCLVRGNRQGNY